MALDQIQQNDTFQRDLLRKQNELDTKLNKNTPIVPGTFTKITYDLNGLVVGGEDATATDLGAEDVLNKSTDVVTDSGSDVKYPSVKAVYDFALALVSGLLDYRGGYDASGNVYPSSGGSESSGDILKADLWIVTVAGTPSVGVTLSVGDWLIATIDTPGQTAGNWSNFQGNFSYAPEDSANKVTSISGSSTDTQYPSAKLTYDQLLTKLSAVTVDSPLTGAGTAASHLSIPAATDSVPGYLTAADHTKLSGLYGALADTYGPQGWSAGQVWNKASVSVVSTTKLQLAMSSATALSYYWRGIKTTITTTLTVTSTIDKAEGIWYCYSTDGTNFVLNQTPFYIFDLISGAIRSDLMVWEFYWDNTNNVALWLQPEIHASTWSKAVHGYAHESLGTRYSGGLDITYGTTASNADTRVKLTTGEIHDEDISAYIVHSATPTAIWEQILGSAGTADANYAALPIYYLSGATPVWRKVTASSYPFLPVSNNYLYYNRNNAGTWDYATSAGVLDFVVYWVVATTHQSDPIVIIPGRQANANLTAAQAETFPSLYGSIFTEFKLLYRIIYQTSAANSNNGKCKIISVTDYRRDAIANNSSATSTPSAALVSYTPSGSIAATNVQAAIEELDTEKEPIITGATAQTCVDADLAISLSGTTRIKTTWTNVKAFLKTYFDTLYAALSGATFTGQIQSSVATGTAPLVVASTTKVSNLNADSVDGAHYAESTWTPNLLDGGGVPVTYTNRYGYYKKIGKLVYITMTFVIRRGSATAANLNFDLPFAAADTTDTASILTGYWNGLDTGLYSMGGQVISGSSYGYIRVAKSAVTSMSGLASTDIPTGADCTIVLNGCYIASS